MEAVRVFARIGLLSFGGPAAQISLMHRELVEENLSIFVGAIGGESAIFTRRSELRKLKNNGHDDSVEQKLRQLVRMDDLIVGARFQVSNGSSDSF